MLRVGTTQTCSVSQSTPEHSNWSGCACYSLTKGQSQFSWSGCMCEGRLQATGCHEERHLADPQQIWSRVRAGGRQLAPAPSWEPSILFQRLDPKGPGESVTHHGLASGTCNYGLSTACPSKMLSGIFCSKTIPYPWFFKGFTNLSAKIICKEISNRQHSSSSKWKT